jgi:hypothetical protein
MKDLAEGKFNDEITNAIEEVAAEVVKDFKI